MLLQKLCLCCRTCWPSQKHRQQIPAQQQAACLANLAASEPAPRCPVAQVVTGDVKKGRRIMVFCNTLDSCRATEHHLSEAGLPTLSYHGALSGRETRMFLNPKS